MGSWAEREWGEAALAQACRENVILMAAVREGRVFSRVGIGKYFL